MDLGGGVENSGFICLEYSITCQYFSKIKYKEVLSTTPISPTPKKYPFKKTTYQNPSIKLIKKIINQKMIALTITSKYLLRTARQAHFWKAKYYQAIPHYVKPHFIDIHDTYKLRTRQQVDAQLKGRQFQIKLQKNVYNTTDIQADHKGRKAILRVDMKQFELTEMQLARFKVLVGLRFKEQTNELKLTCQMFDNYEQNHTKIHQMFYDIIMETKRAP